MTTPDDIKETTRENPRRCWTCGFYSFKSFASEDDNSGKCFRDGDRTIYGVTALMTCEKFLPDDTPAD